MQLRERCPVAALFYGVDWGVRGYVVVRADGQEVGRYEFKGDIEEAVKVLLRVIPPKSYIVVERLKGVRKRLRKVPKGYFPFLKFQRTLMRYASVMGIKVIKVEPAGTSQCCPRCGLATNLNRLRHTFHCHHCGFQGDADYVGALNIARRGLEKHRTYTVEKLRKFPS